MNKSQNFPEIKERAYEIVLNYMLGRHKELGANIGQELRRECPEFNAQQLGFRNLRHFLVDHMDCLVVTGRQGGDLWWSLADYVEPEVLDEALAATELEDESSDFMSLPVNKAAYLKSIYLENFGSCQLLELTFTDKFTMLVGANAAGKSSILRGISYASQVAYGRVASIFSGPRSVARIRSLGCDSSVYLGLTSSEKVTLHFEIKPGEYRPTFLIEVTGKNKKKVGRWTDKTSKMPELAELKAFWPSAICSFNAAALAKPSPLKENPRLGDDGSGLPTLLASFATSDPERLKQVLEGVQQLVPQVEAVRQVMRERPVFGYAANEGSVKEQLYYLEVQISSQWVAADLLSEGTLLAFGILTMMHQKYAPRLILIDDIDRGLHPKAQRELVRVLKEISLREDGPQLVLTSHSPTFLDEIDPSSVIVVRHTDKGTKARRLTDHEMWSEWEGNMRAGEFWSYVGEDWIS